MSKSAQAKSRNAAAKQNYEHMLAVREHEWYQQLSVWGAQRNKYYTDLTESDLAAQRGYAEAQVGLNDQFAAAAQRNESKLIEYLQGSGKLAAAGRTGRSIKRIGTLDLGALERSAGREFYKLTRSKQAYKANVENIRSQKISDQNEIWGRAAFAPIPDLAPPPPIYEKEGMGMMDILNVAAQTAMGFAAGGGKFGNPLKGMKGKGASSFKDSLKMTQGQSTGLFGGSFENFGGSFLSPGSNMFSGSGMGGYGTSFMSQGMPSFTPQPQQSFWSGFLGGGGQFGPIGSFIGKDLSKGSTWQSFWNASRSPYSSFNQIPY